MVKICTNERRCVLVVLLPLFITVSGLTSCTPTNIQNVPRFSDQVRVVLQEKLPSEASRLTVEDDREMDDPYVRIVDNIPSVRFGDGSESGCTGTIQPSALARCIKFVPPAYLHSEQEAIQYCLTIFQLLSSNAEQIYGRVRGGFPVSCILHFDGRPVSNYKRHMLRIQLTADQIESANIMKWGIKDVCDRASVYVDSPEVPSGYTINVQFMFRDTKVFGSLKEQWHPCW